MKFEVKKIGNSRNRSRKKRKIPPSSKGVVNQDSKPRYKYPGPSGKKIGMSAEAFREMSKNIDSAIKEGTIFMDLSILFDVFDVLKCPDCGCDNDSHVELKKKSGHSNYIVSQRKNI